MRLTLKEITKIVEGKLEGSEEIVIEGVAGLREATSKDISFLGNPKYAKDLADTKAGAVIVPPGTNTNGKPSITVKNPQLAFSKILDILAKEKTSHPEGVHPTAVIDRSADIGKGVAMGAYVFLDKNTVIGNNTIIYPHCYIGHNTRIGSNCIIYPNVTIREEIKIGNNCIIHSGTVVGSDGYGFVYDKGEHRKIPQLGNVEIEDNVEIGACVTIDRATTGTTRIGSGTKIDNLVQIAHNVQTGKNCLIIAQTGVAGSTKIEDNVTIAAQAGIAGHLKIGQGSTIAARGGVISDMPPKSLVSGFPAKPHREEIKLQALMRKLPEIYEMLKKIKKHLKI